jgi:hypothetical protein
MVHDMDDQSHEPIDKVFPSSGLLGQTARQQIAVDF